MNTLRYVFNPAGDLTNLVDGANHATRWILDRFGLVRTNVNALGQEAARLSFDANNRLTNRWTPAKSNAVYSYDAMGNVTNISYRAGTTQTVSYAYDALNRLTNMVDASGTNSFTWRNPLPAVA